MRLSDFSTLTFDCYGTLIDWEAGLHQALLPLFANLEPAPSKEDVLTSFSNMESRTQQDQPDLGYRSLLGAVYRNLAEELNVACAEADHERFGDSIASWPAFDDSVESLQYLKQHFKLVILSNVDNQGFAMSNRRLQVEFDEIYTAEDIGSYKPSHRNFEYMLERLGRQGVSKDSILHTAQSLHHDMVPATAFGLARCWIDRRADRPGFGATPPVETQVEVDFRFKSLAEMVRAHQRENA